MTVTAADLAGPKQRGLATGLNEFAGSLSPHCIINWFLQRRMVAAVLLSRDRFAVWVIASALFVRETAWPGWKPNFTSAHPFRPASQSKPSFAHLSDNKLEDRFVRFASRVGE
jgi:hypothetical protein